MYTTRVGIALSVLFNVLLGGESNQTFSARNWGWERDGKFNLCNVIDFFFGQGHCLECWAYWRIAKRSVT